MSNPNLPPAFDDSVAQVRTDGALLINLALEFAQSMLKTASGELDVLVPTMTSDAQEFLEGEARKHGLQIFVSAFQGSINAGRAQLNAASSNFVREQVADLVAKLEGFKVNGVPPAA